jgi:DNA-binding HxlR family transcriptional regulator
MCSWPFSCVLCPRRDLRPAPSARTVTLPRDIDADSPCHLGETLRPRPRASFVARRHHQRQSQVQGYRLQTQSCGRELRPSCQGLSAWQTQRIAPFAARPSYALPARTWQRVPRAPAGQCRMPAGRSHCLPSSASLRPMSLPSEHTQSERAGLARLREKATAIVKWPFGRRRHIASDVQRQSHVSHRRQKSSREPFEFCRRRGLDSHCILLVVSNILRCRRACVCTAAVEIG